MDEDSDWSSSSGYQYHHHHHPRLNHGLHHHSNRALPDYGTGRSHHHAFYHHPPPPPHSSASSPSSSWRPEPWTHGDTYGSHPYRHNCHSNSTTGSSRSTFEEVESLCLSRSSNDSFGQFHAAQHRYGASGGSNSNSSNSNSNSNSSNNIRGVGVPPLPPPPPPQQQQQPTLPHPLPPPSHPYGRGGSAGRFLSRQSSTTSTSTSSGNVAGGGGGGGEHPWERRSAGGSTSTTSGSVHEEAAMETLDPRQQFDLQHDHALLDGIFRRVLEWNNTHAALGGGGGERGGGGGGVGGGGAGPPLPFPQVPLGGYPYQGFYPPPHHPSLPHAGYEPPIHSGGGPGYPGARPGVLPGQRAAGDGGSKARNLSSSSDITHVKKRRDLILPDEEEEVSFARPYGCKPDGSPRGAPGKAQSRSTSSMSSKMPSSDSWNSSSSVSQGQDLNWREHYYGHGAQPWREHFAPGWGDPYAGHWRGADPHAHPVWRDQPPPQSGMSMHPGYSNNFHSSAGMSRGLSVESMSSYGIASPPAAYIPAQCFPPNRQNSAEMMLMNLGFGGSSDGFLPERFLKDWYNKLSQSQVAVNHAVESTSNSPHGSLSNLHQPREPKVPLRSKPSYEDLRSASDLHRRITNHLSRATTISTSHDASEPSKAKLPPSMGSQSRADRLKEYIEAHAHNVASPPNARSLRMHQFASSRQKSLPSYLETLTEEDEAKTRSTPYKPQDGKSHLHTFLREDSFSSKSESQNTSSGCTSNSQLGSESESQSGSDYFDNRQMNSQRFYTSREQPVTTQPAPVTHRFLTLRKQASMDVEKEQSKVEMKADNSLDMPTTPRKRHKHGNRSRHSSPKRQADSPHQNPSANLSVSSSLQTVGHESVSSSRCSSPKKEHRAKSPGPRSKSPSHRPRSPRHHRGRSPCKELKSITTGDDVLRAKAPKSSFDDSSSSGSPHRKKKPTPEATRLSVTETNEESPKRNQENSSVKQLSVDKPNNESVDKSAFNHDIQNRSDRLSKLPEISVDCESSNNEVHEQDDSFDPKSDRGEPLVSTESIEVADIFQNRHNGQSSESQRSAGRGQGELEPALISIVLQDVDGNMTESGPNLNSASNDQDVPCSQQNEESQQHVEDLLHLPPCSSSLSVSPVPMSPVTVIEVSLDNQQDSIDTEEGTSSSKELTEDGDASVVDSDTMQTVTDFLSEDTDPGEFPVLIDFAADRYLPGSLPLLQRPSSVADTPAPKLMRDVGVEADDGSTSPLLMLNDGYPMMSSSSSSSSPVGLSTNLSDVGIQSDDGRLTPLVMFKQEKTLTAVIQNDVIEDLYFVSDRAVQCDGHVFFDGTDTSRTCEADYVSEVPLLEMAHKVTQTSHLVRYEMSSQTEMTVQKSPTKPGYARDMENNPKGKAGLRNQMHGSESTVSMNSDLDFRHKTSNKERNCHGQTPGINSPESISHLADHTSRDSHNLSMSQSFESEFWDYLGMEIPGHLKKSQTSFEMNRKPRTHLASDMSTRKGPTDDQHRGSLSTRSLSPRPTRASAGLQDRCDSPQSSPRGQTHSSLSEGSPGSPARLNKHGICPLTMSGNLLQMSPERNGFSRTACSLSPSSHFHALSSSGKSLSSGTLLSPKSMKHESMNTCDTVPAAQSDSVDDPTSVKESHCSFVKPFLLSQCTLNQDQLQGEGSPTQSHVSILTYNVGDYRHLDSRSPSPDNPWCASVDCGKQHTCADNNAQTELAPETKPFIHPGVWSPEALTTEPCGASALESDGNSQQNTVLQHEEFQQHSDEMLATRPNSLFSGHGELCFSKTSTPGETATTPQVSMPDSKTQQPSLTATPSRGFKPDKEIPQEIDDTDLTSKEEARKLAMKMFLLKSSVDSDSKQSDSSVQTVVDATQDNVLPFERKVIPSWQVGRDKSDDAKAKVMQLFLLRESSVSPVMPFETPPLSKEESVQEVSKVKSDMTGIATHTASDSVNNHVFDCFPPDEEAGEKQSINPCARDENKTDSEKVVEKEPSRAEIKSDAVEDTGYKSNIKSTIVCTEETNKTLEDRQSCLLETFAHSVIESACHELQKNYMKNKQKLQERMQGELKLTGIFQASTKDAYPSTSEEKLTVGMDSEGEVGILNTTSDVSTEESGRMVYPNMSNTDTMSVTSDAECDSCGVSSGSVTEASVEKRRYNNHIPFQMHVETEDDPIPSQEGNSPADVFSDSRLQVQSSEGVLLSLSRCLSSESLSSLRVNFSESIDDLTDVMETDDATSHSQSMQYDSEDDTFDLSIFEPKDPTSPIIKESKENSDDDTDEQINDFEPQDPHTFVITPHSGDSDSDTLADRTVSTGLHFHHRLGPSGDHQLVTSAIGGFDLVEQENWFSSTIDLESTDLTEELSMYETHEDDFESLLFLSGDVTQNSCPGHGLVGYLPKITEEVENVDQMTDQPEDMDMLAGGGSGTQDTPPSQSSSETQSSGKSSVEWAPEEADFGIEVSLQPLPAKFDPKELTIKSVNDSTTFREPVTRAEETKEEHVDILGKSLMLETEHPDDHVDSLHIPSGTNFDCMDNTPISASFLRVENRDLKSPDLFAKSEFVHEKASAINFKEVTNIDQINTRNDFVDSETASDQEIARILHGETRLGSAQAPPVPLTGTTPDQTVGQDGTRNRTSSRSSPLTKQNGFETDEYPSITDVKVQTMDAEETKLVVTVEKKETLTMVISDTTNSESCFSEENTSSPAPKLVNRFHHSISSESSSSEQSPRRTTVSTLLSPGLSTSLGASTLLYVPQTNVCLVPKNTLSKCGSSSSESDLSSQPRSQSPVPDAASPPGCQSPVCGQSSSPTEGRFLHSPTLASSNTISPIPMVVLCSDENENSVQLLSGAGSRDSSSGQASPLSDRMQYRSNSPLSDNIQTGGRSSVSGSIQNRSHSPVSDNIQNRSHSPVSDSIQNRSRSPVSGSIQNRSHSPVSGSIQNRSHSPVSDSMQNRSHSPVSDSIQNRSRSPVSGSIQNRSHSPVSDNIQNRSHSPVSDNIQNRSHSPVSDSIQNRSHSPVSDSMQNRSQSPVSSSIQTRSHSPVSDSIQNRSHSPVSDIVQNRSHSPVSDNIQNRSHSPVSDNIQNRSHSPLPDSPQSSNHSPEDDSVFLSDPPTAFASSSLSDQSSTSSRTAFSGNTLNVSDDKDNTHSSHTDILTTSCNAEDFGASENAYVHRKLSPHSVCEKEETPLSPETAKPLQPQQSRRSPTTLTLESSSPPPPAKPVPRLQRSPKKLTPSRTMSSSGDESAPLQFTLSRTFFSSEASSRAHTGSLEGEKKSSSSSSPIPSTPSLSRDHSSTSESSSSVKDTQQPAPFQRTQAKSVSSTAESDRKQGLLGTRFVVTGLPSIGSSSTVRETGSANLHVEAETSRDKESSKTGSNETKRGPKQDLTLTDSQNQPGTSITSVKPKVPPKPKSLSLLHLRRSRFQNTNNTTSALEILSSSSENSSAENDATPKRRFFWSTDQRTVVSPAPDQGRDGSDSGPGDQQHRRSGAASDANSVSDDSDKKGSTSFANPPLRRPRCLRKVDNSDCNSRGNRTSSQSASSSSSFSSDMRGGVSSDTERLSHNRQLRVFSPAHTETKSDSEIPVSTNSDRGATENNKSSRRTVRELARQFETK